MISSPNATRARLADLALAVYLAPLLERRRVVAVGPTSGELCRRARALGAHTVVSFGGVGEDIAVRALVPGALASMHGKVDVIVVPDAGAVPSLVAVLDEARRALGSEGIVVIASEPDDGPAPLESGAKRSVGYHDLEDLCLARFANVRMLGRGPFVGYTLATLDEGSDDVTLDTRLIDGDPPRPEAFVAVCSDTEIALDPLAVVQVPSEVLDGVKAGAAKGLEDELAKRDQKLKEVEAASAERWVKIQRFEHATKELEDENRKARDKAVRLSKDLEDERKLRQRIELEAQMSRRAPELPKTPDHEPELKRLRELSEQLERDLRAARQGEHAARSGAESVVRELADQRAHADAAQRELADARAKLTAATGRVGDLERELDETLSAEADLRAQLDEAVQRAEAVDLGRDLARAMAEAETLREELARAKDGSAIEGEYARMERALSEQSAELGRLRSERARMEQAVRELTLTLTELQGRDVVEEAAELRSRLSAMASVHAALVERAEALAAESAVLRDRVVLAESQVVALTGELQQARWSASEAEGRRGAVDDTAQLAAVEAARQEAIEAREEASRLYGINVGMEARLVQTAMELEGARAGYSRRVAELERESDRLMRALEVSASQTSFDGEAAMASLQRDLHAAQAEREGLSWRLREAESALEALSKRAAPTMKLVEEADDEPGDAESLLSGTRMDQVLADLSATAERLARTEEELARVRHERDAALREAYTASVDPADMVELRAEIDALVRRVDELVRDRDRKVGEVESLLGQLSERDLRLVDLERRREEELIASQTLVVVEAQSNRSLRGSLEAVRAGLSAILVDGRGAMVAHDLMTLLRRIEESE